MSAPSTSKAVSSAIMIGTLFVFAALPYASFHLAGLAKDDLQNSQALFYFNANQLEKLKSNQAAKTAAAQKTRSDLAVTPSKGLGLAGAELQSLLSRLIRNGSGRPGSLQVLPPTIEGQFAKITVQAVFKASNQAFRQIILDIERHVPFVFIEQLSVRNLFRPNSDNALASGEHLSGNGRETLEISIRASNYMKTSNGAKKRVE